MCCLFASCYSCSLFLSEQIKMMMMMIALLLLLLLLLIEMAEKVISIQL